MIGFKSAFLVLSMVTVVIALLTASLGVYGLRK